MRFTQPIARALPALTLALAACSVIGAPPPPTPEAFTALYQVRTGPYPLYEEFGDWLADRVGGMSPSQAEDATMTARRVAEVQNRTSPDDGLWLRAGCLFDVQATSPDQQDPSYVWAYGRVVRCDEVISTRLPEPQMGIKPHALRIYDGWPGYFPMSLLDAYQGAPPPPRK